MGKALPLLLLSVVGVMLLAYTPSGAADDNRVALVVDYGNGQIATRCVSFSEESISGFEVLERTGLPVETDFQTGGAAVCRIDAQGCPANDCFCACRGGGDCVYWSYWHLNNGVWNYSAAGSGLYEVRDGAVEGWVWGLGSVTQASPPPPVTFADICVAAPADTPTLTLTPSRTSTPIVLPTAQPTAGSVSIPAAATETVGPTGATPSPQPSPLGETRPAATVQSSPPPPTPAGQTASTPNPSPLAPLPQLGAVDTDPEFSPQPTPVSSSVTGSEQADDVEPIVTSGDEGPIEIAALEPVLPTVVEPTGGLVIGAVTEQDALSSRVAAAVAVVGADAVVMESDTLAAVLPAGDLVNPNSYAGFAGLLLLLCAVALLVRRRRYTTDGDGR